MILPGLAAAKWSVAWRVLLLHRETTGLREAQSALQNPGTRASGANSTALKEGPAPFAKWRRRVLTRFKGFWED
jgi:hypothetical protein